MHNVQNAYKKLANDNDVKSLYQKLHYFLIYKYFFIIAKKGIILVEHIRNNYQLQTQSQNASQIQINLFSCWICEATISYKTTN